MSRNILQPGSPTNRVESIPPAASGNQGGIYRRRREERKRQRTLDRMQTSAWKKKLPCASALLETIRGSRINFSQLSHDRNRSMFFDPFTRVFVPSANNRAIFESCPIPQMFSGCFLSIFINYDTRRMKKKKENENVVRYLLRSVSRFYERA